MRANPSIIALNLRSDGEWSRFEDWRLVSPLVFGWWKREFFEIPSSSSICWKPQRWNDIFWNPVLTGYFMVLLICGTWSIGLPIGVSREAKNRIEDRHHTIMAHAHETDPGPHSCDVTADDVTSFMTSPWRHAGLNDVIMTSSQFFIVDTIFPVNMTEKVMEDTKKLPKNADGLWIKIFCHMHRISGQYDQEKTGKVERTWMGHVSEFLEKKVFIRLRTSRFFTQNDKKP